MPLNCRYVICWVVSYDLRHYIGPCIDRTSTLDSDVWNVSDACLHLDALKESCNNVVDGAFAMASAYGSCNGGANTYSKFRYKYGYLEVKYTVNLDYFSGYLNYAFVVYPKTDRYSQITSQYNVVVDDWEDFLRNESIEIDIFEYVVNQRLDVFHQYANWGFQEPSPDLRPIRTAKYLYYCSNFSTSIIRNPNRCRRSDTVTMTRGIEWTPRGYRTHIKVDGLADDWTVVPKDKILVQYRPVHERNNGNGYYVGGRTTLLGAARDRYFEYTDPTDAGTILEQVAVSHAPAPLSFATWGYPRSSEKYIKTRMKIDYIRVWQPENLYTDMEPVYQ